ncbi:hypothetical protein Tco_0570999 [Tanacetum coccineum]
MLSIGGRSTLVSLVLGALRIYYLSLFSMPVNIANSLGIGSLQALNLSLIQNEDGDMSITITPFGLKSSLPFMAIALLGIDGSTALGYGSGRGPLQEMDSLYPEKGQHYDLESFARSPSNLLESKQERVSRLGLSGSFATAASSIIALLGIDGSTALGYGSGRGPLQESISDTNSFSIKGTHVHIDNFMLPDVHSPTRWIRCILKKVNIMIWRALRDRLPTCWNLSRKASEIWHKVFMWLDHLFPVINSFATIFEWVEDLEYSASSDIVQSI